MDLFDSMFDIVGVKGDQKKKYAETLQQVSLVRFKSNVSSELSQAEQQELPASLPGLLEINKLPNNSLRIKILAIYGTTMLEVLSDFLQRIDKDITVQQKDDLKKLLASYLI